MQLTSEDKRFAKLDLADKTAFDRLVRRAGPGKLTWLKACCDKAKRNGKGAAVEAAKIELLRFVKATTLTHDEYVLVSDRYYVLDLWGLPVDKCWYEASSVYEYIKGLGQEESTDDD